MSGFRASGRLCLLLIDYVTPLDKVDAQMAAHVAWMDKGFAEGLFLVAGRQHPRTGGVILCRGDAEQVRPLAETDPFVTSGVATVRVVAFNASFAAPEIAALLA